MPSSSFNNPNNKWTGCKGRAVVAGGPLDVMDMTPDQVRGNFFQPLLMVEQAEVVFELDVTEIMPITDRRMVGEVSLESDHFAFRGHVLEAGPGFDRQLDSDFRSAVGEGGQRLDGAMEIERAEFFAFSHKRDFFLDVVVAVLTA